MYLNEYGLETCRRTERLLIQQVDRDMEDIMYYEEQNSIESEQKLEVARQSLKHHAKKLEEIQEYIAEHE